MVSARRRIERMKKSLALSRAAMNFKATVVFIDMDGVVKKTCGWRTATESGSRMGSRKEAAAG
jgi:hypothetical protein